MMELALKIDVDTEQGTKLGVPALTKLLKKLQIPATFYFSLGPDNTGRAIKRLFKKHFLKKCFKTNVFKIYGWKTLTSGLFRFSPIIGEKHASLLAQVEKEGFDVGIHAYDHQYWQNNLFQMAFAESLEEFSKAVQLFTKIYAHTPETAAAPGWQADQKVIKIYEFFDLKYVSDCRGYSPFYPKFDKKISKILEIPTTLPTLDELLITTSKGEQLTQRYLKQLTNFNVLTLHAELEGLHYYKWFEQFLNTLQKYDVRFITLKELTNRKYDVGQMHWDEFNGRAGWLARQR